MATAPQTTQSAILNADDLGDVLRDYMEVTRRLQHTHETLQREVIRLRDEVETKDRELERKRRLAALGELAAGVAHEIRNPLGAVRLYSGLLRSKLGAPEEATELIEKIDAGIHAIDCVVQDTLALAPRSGARRLKPLSEILDGARDVCRAAFESCEVTLREQRNDVEAEILADAAALQRVFVNLMVNAAQASSAGATVLLRVEQQVAGEVEIRVIDEGTGLPDELIDRIFDPFFTTKESGTGLGLTIAHRLVEANGGRLGARNRSEKGAEFVVVLPTSVDEPCAVRPVGASQTSAA